MLIVEIVDVVKKRVFVYVYDKVILLVDIVMYIDVEEVFLSEVLEVVKKKENGVVVFINYKKVLVDELYVYFVEVLLNYDCDCVYNGDIKKLILWYNILVNNGIIEFVEVLVDFVDKVEEVVVE